MVLSVSALVLSFHGHFEVALTRIEVTPIAQVDRRSARKVAEHGIERYCLAGEHCLHARHIVLLNTLRGLADG
jgi:hypothetical protein